MRCVVTIIEIDGVTTTWDYVSSIQLYDDRIVITEGTRDRVFHPQDIKIITMTGIEDN